VHRTNYSCNENQEDEQISKGDISLICVPLSGVYRTELRFRGREKGYGEFKLSSSILHPLNQTKKYTLFTMNINI
jgi:hypothetical protein